MKVNFDTADYFNFKTVVWGLLLLAALIIVYHAGFIHGECSAQRHFKHMMYMRALHAKMPIHDGMFMQGVSPMMPGMQVMGREGGSIRMRAGESVQPPHGMRVMKMHGDGSQDFFLFRSE